MTETLRELAHRAGDGLDVRLLWDEALGTLTVAVDDWKTGDSFQLEARRDNALDVFHHPFAYRRAG